MPNMVTVETVRGIKVRRPDLSGDKWCFYPLLGFNLAAEFEGAEPGERIEVEYVEIPQAEVDAMPDFDGW